MDDLNAGNQFGGYKLLGKLGKGGMGKVYKAKDIGFDRVVAIKITETLENVSEDDIRRFEAEAHAMKNLDHQNITPVYNYGLIEDRQYIAMKFVQGKTMADIISSKKLKVKEIIDLAKQVARALLFAHSHKIVHRDVKPSNIMIQPDGHLYLGDFGISYALNQARFTKVGMAMGTPEYMSPEQCQGLKLNTRSDIYAFGVMLYELCTGLPPFTGDKPLSIAYKHVHEELPLSPDIIKMFPTGIFRIVEDCLQKDPSRRPSDMGIILDDLDKLPQGNPSQVLSTAHLKELKSILAKRSLSSLSSPNKVAPFLTASHLKFLWLSFGLLLIWNLYAHFSSTPKTPQLFVKNIHYISPVSGDTIKLNSISNIKWKHRETKGYMRLELILSRDYLIQGLGIKWKRQEKDAPPPARIILKANSEQKRQLKMSQVKNTQYFAFHPMVSNKFEIQLPGSERFTRNPHIIQELILLGVPFQ